MRLEPCSGLERGARVNRQKGKKEGDVLIDIQQEGAKPTVASLAHFFLFKKKTNWILIIAHFEETMVRSIADEKYGLFQKINDSRIQKHPRSPYAKSTVRWTKHDQCWMHKHGARNLWIWMVNRRKSWWGGEGTVEGRSVSEWEMRWSS